MLSLYIESCFIKDAARFGFGSASVGFSLPETKPIMDISNEVKIFLFWAVSMNRRYSVGYHDLMIISNSFLDSMSNFKAILLPIRSSFFLFLTNASSNDQLTHISLLSLRISLLVSISCCYTIEKPHYCFFLGVVSSARVVQILLVYDSNEAPAYTPMWNDSSRRLYFSLIFFTHKNAWLPRRNLSPPILRGSTQRLVPHGSHCSIC